MKAIILLLSIVSQFCLSADFIETKNDSKIIKKIDSNWFISKIRIKDDYYSSNHNYLNEWGKKERAIVIEPYYSLQSYGEEGFASSPIKRIIKNGDSYLVYTLSGSIYKAPASNLVSIDSMAAFLNALSNDMISCLSVYKRRDLQLVKTGINELRIMPGQNYKTWQPYSFSSDESDFQEFSNRLRNLRENEEIDTKLSDEDLEILDNFH